VDYKDLFKKLVNEKGTGALQVYSAELDDSAGGASPDVLMQDRLKKGRERLDQALEAVELLCAPVDPPAVQPNRELAHIHYFCGNVEIPEDLKAHEHQRFALYKAVAALLRAYANIADDLPQAGYREPQIARIKADVTRGVDLRELIRLASNETIDLKAYEADMRHLIDTYIEARDPKKISAFDDMGLLEVIERSGLAEAIAQMPGAIRKNNDAVAETIANNVRSKIVKEHLNDPAFYDKMSALLKEILDDLKAKRISYEKFLKRIAEEVIKPVQKGTGADTPKELDTPAKRALFSNLPKPKESASLRDVDLDPRVELVLAIDNTVRNSRQDSWRGNFAKESLIKQALLPVLNYDDEEIERLFPIIVAQTEY
jgi:type I restriction enzyme R subunit